jgi:soluble lytic murein transglycosylase-like protein
MENTARIIAENLGYSYEHEMLLDPQFNIKLTLTQLSYLKNVYDNDLHKVLNAYNRGQKGLEDYLKSQDVRGISDYSLKVLQYAKGFKEEFENR